VGIEQRVSARPDNEGGEDEGPIARRTVGKGEEDRPCHDEDTFHCDQVSIAELPLQVVDEEEYDDERGDTER
jgi:hypothetical protein